MTSMSSLCRLLLLVSVVALCVASSGSVSPLASLVPTLRQSLQEIADAEAKKYGCAFAIALRGANGVAVEASSGAGKAGAKAMFAWGSVTKLVTGVSIIRLANEGVLSLDETVAPILDPYWVKHGDANVTMVGMFGEAAKRVTIRHLATMMAGVPDFDTAKPNETDFARSTDPFRATCYAQPGKDWSPYDLLSLPWVSNGTMVFEPGTQKAYSSTNFMLLGFVLAAKANGGAGVPWDHLNQLAFRPPHETALLNHSLFARHGAPSPTFVSLDAFDRTSYNGHNASARPGTDVSAVHGVFGGWSASDIVAPVADIAQLAFDIFGPQSASSLVSAENISMMVNASQEWYGFATFLLSAFTGMPTDAPTGVDYGTCWGHLGATYGWNSVVQFTPGTNTTIAVATNVETNEQAGPSDAYCVAYNRVRQLVERELARRVDATSAAASKPIEDCEYVASGYFGTCVCPGTFYHCEMSHDGSGGKRCVISYFANQTYADCAVGCK